MATTQIVKNKTVSIIDTLESFYKSPGGGSGTIIGSFTASNTSTVNASYKAYIISEDEQQPQIPFKIVVWGENDLGIGIVNQIIPPGGHLSIECSALDSIYFTVTGRET